jgi:hypothetical protein
MTSCSSDGGAQAEEQQGMASRGAAGEASRGSHSLPTAEERHTATELEQGTLSQTLGFRVR